MLWTLSLPSCWMHRSVLRPSSSTNTGELVRRAVSHQPGACLMYCHAVEAWYEVGILLNGDDDEGEYKLSVRSSNAGITSGCSSESNPATGRSRVFRVILENQPVDD